VDLARASQGAGYPGVVSGHGRADGGAYRDQPEGRQPPLKVAAWLPSSAGPTLGGRRPRLSGRVTGGARKKFSIIASDSMQGSLSQIIAVRCGQHKIGVKIEAGDGAAQEDSIKGDFSSNAEPDLLVSAHHSSLSLSWHGTSWHSGRTVVEPYVVVALCWLLFSDHGGTSHVAIAGYVLQELPARLRPASDSASNSVVSKNG
jgi:hypothetical protein